jgi:hypothetical protein
MPPPNAQKPGRKKPKGASLPISAPPTGELVLRGNLADLTYAFVGRPRRLVTCPVPDSIYQKIQNHPGGVSHFIEDAVASFDGDLNALVIAAVAFVDNRRFRASTDPPRNASGRVLPATFAKIQQVQDALASIRGMSRAKVVAGLVQLFLERSTGTTPTT